MTPTIRRARRAWTCLAMVSQPLGRQVEPCLKALHHRQRAPGDGFRCRRIGRLGPEAQHRMAASRFRTDTLAETGGRRRSELPYLGSPGAGTSSAEAPRWCPPALRAPPGATRRFWNDSPGTPQRGSSGRQPVCSRPPTAGSLQAIARLSDCGWHPVAYSRAQAPGDERPVEKSDSPRTTASPSAHTSASRRVGSNTSWPCGQDSHSTSGCHRRRDLRHEARGGSYRF